MVYYVAVQDKSGVWYATKKGYDIPVMGSFSKTRRGAQKYAAACMALTYSEYMEDRRKHPKQYE